MKTKTVLIKAVMPEDFNENLISVSCVYDKYMEPVNFEIIEPPTYELIERDINISGANMLIKAGIRIGMKRMLQILGI